MGETDNNRSLQYVWQMRIPYVGEGMIRSIFCTLLVGVYELLKPSCKQFGNMY